MGGLLGLLSRLSPAIGRAGGWIGSKMGITAAVIGGGVAAEALTEKTNESGKVIEKGVLGKSVEKAANVLGGGLRSTEDYTKDVDAKLKAREGIVSAEQASATAAAQKSAEVESELRLLRMRAQEKSLQGQIGKANFWTGTFGSIIVDLINAVAPNSAFSDWANRQIAEARSTNEQVKQLIDAQSPINAASVAMPESEGLAGSNYKGDYPNALGKKGPISAPETPKAEKAAQNAQDITTKPHEKETSLQSKPAAFIPRELRLG